jgi:hypothetical protein
MRFANLRKSGRTHAMAERFPYFHQTEGTCRQNPRTPSALPAKNYYSLTTVGVFHRGIQRSANALGTPVGLLKQKRNSWCREGESNPQGTKYRRILSPLRLPVPPSRLGDVYLSLPMSAKSTWLRWHHAGSTRRRGHSPCRRPA